MVLSDDQRRRYARNISLVGIGEAGQEKLLSSHVLVAGAGGLGSAVISYLAGAGVGHITIADHDRVELSNLQRQILHETGDIGRLKAESARDRVEEINPDVKVTIHTQKLDNANTGKLIAECDIVADGTDNFATRFAIADACHTMAKPLVSASIRAYDGQLAVFKSYLGAPHACYHCLVGSLPDDERGCSDVGVLGALAGVMGSLQALQVIKELLWIGETMADKLFLLDGKTLATRVANVTRDPQCNFCSAAMKKVARPA
jgi:adenylyltransferase/sulfurtransferase